MTSASTVPAKRERERTTNIATTTPSPRQSAVLPSERRRLFLTDRAASSCERAPVRCASVYSSGSTVMNHFAATACRTTPRCGRSATSVTPPKSAHAIRRSQGEAASTTARVAPFVVASTGRRRERYRPSMNSPAAMTSTTTTSAKPDGSTSTDWVLSKILFDTTFWYPKTSGVPRSVNAQINVIAQPAKTPGSMRGRVTRRKRASAESPSDCAASSSAGSTFAIAAVRFRYMIG